jgi:sterol 14-demethylase
MYIYSQDYFSKWGEDGIVDLKYELDYLIMLITSRRFLGKDVREKLFDEVYSLIHCIGNGISLISVLFPYIPIPVHNRRDIALVKLEEIFSKLIRSRRNSSLVEDDILQKLIDSKYNDGRCTTEGEVCGMTLAMIFAGEHTSSNASTWTGASLLSNAKWWSAAVEEQKQIIHGSNGRIDYSSLSEMDVLHRCIKEALRMHPTAPVLLRKAHKQFVVHTKEGNEYEIPAEHTVVVPMLTNSMLPYIYKDPHVYDPDRFADPGRKEDKVGGKNSYIAFGSGSFTCIGEAYAYLQLKIIWSHLLRNFELKLVSPYPDTDWSSYTVGPKGKVLVSYTRRCLSST